jgi:serine/threonine protein kinase
MSSSAAAAAAASQQDRKRDIDIQNAGSDEEPPSMDVRTPSLPLTELNGEPTYVRELGRGRIGIALEAQIDGFPLPVAIKIADLAKMETAEEELKHEYGAYMRMVKLWGLVVPFLVWCGPMPFGRAGLATTLAGKRTLEQHLKQGREINMRALERTLRDGLAQIHACGLAHGDVEMRNIVVEEEDEEEGDGKKGKLVAKFIDFGSSTILEDDKSNALDVKEEQERDLVYLRNLLTNVEIGE